MTRKARTAHARSRARSWTLQVLYAHEVNATPLPLPDFLERVLETRRMSPRYRPHVERLLGLLESHGREIDRRIEDAMPNWRLERLGAVERAILRIGASELLFDPTVPPRVAIHEALQLAERYAGAESTRFVNGVLDALYHDGG